MPIEVPEEARAYWAAWLADPEQDPVREIAERFPPWSTFKLRPTGQIVCVVGFFENDTLRVEVLPNAAEPWRMFGFEVFGIDPDDLEPLDAPAN